LLAKSTSILQKQMGGAGENIPGRHFAARADMAKRAEADTMSTTKRWRPRAVAAKYGNLCSMPRKHLGDALDLIERLRGSLKHVTDGVAEIAPDARARVPRLDEAYRKAVELLERLDAEEGEGTA
jgi:hypothetical protein